ncbi:hypothetical protein THII_2252 [Thioploca ingrica]|uniref:Uncharacterized protein n=1 Tax=Thioploca ingrica TaxID=40754 RepID=A0A090AH46_9GAMM|nr:hypothetical protein THII_2252 [Thioploca ingrica]
MGNWILSHRADLASVKIADRHYSRKKPGTSQFVKPGRCIVLISKSTDTVWVSSYQLTKYVKHAWAGVWECSFFRND